MYQIVPATSMVESPADTARTAYKPREHKFKCSGSQVLRWHCNVLPF